MTKILRACIVLSFLSIQIYTQAQTTEIKTDSIYSIIYFGATSCYYCNVPKNIENINKMTVGIKKGNPAAQLKLVIVSMDKDLNEGQKFLDKYEMSNWNEISIGSFYQNELALAYLNNTAIPGVPHLFVIKHMTEIGKFNVPIVKSSKILVDLVGGDQLDKWLDNSCRFEK